MSQAAEKLAVTRPGSIKDAHFNWEDPLDLEGLLTEEERMVRDTARGYAQDKLMPRVIEAYREEKVDRTLLPEMGALGLLGPNLPEEYGGAGLGYVAYGLINREIERVEHNRMHKLAGTQRHTTAPTKVDFASEPRQLSRLASNYSRLSWVCGGWLAQLVAMRT